jgi:hypothetical protein
VSTYTNKIDVLECKYCNEKFKYRQCRWRHEHKCKIENNNNQIITTNNNNNNNNNNCK